MRHVVQSSVSSPKKEEIRAALIAHKIKAKTFYKMLKETPPNSAIFCSTFVFRKFKCRVLCEGTHRTKYFFAFDDFPDAFPLSVMEKQEVQHEVCWIQYIN
ncbi:hypothetical protein C0J52_16629 [Blattella germanica]|nr:hypothetical protein C0J52_16629 [Blattella germanica]